MPSEDHTVQLPDSLWGDSVTQEKFHYYSKQDQGVGVGVGVWGCVRWEIWRVLPSEDHTAQLPDSLLEGSVIPAKHKIKVVGTGHLDGGGGRGSLGLGPERWRESPSKEHTVLLPISLSEDAKISRIHTSNTCINGLGWVGALRDRERSGVWQTLWVWPSEDHTVQLCDSLLVDSKIHMVNSAQYWQIKDIN